MINMHTPDLYNESDLNSTGKVIDLKVDSDYCDSEKENPDLLDRGSQESVMFTGMVSVNIADSVKSRNTEIAMSMYDSYIRVPRSLLRHPLWIDLPAISKSVFFTILDYAVFKETPFDDHGHIIILKPGQLCISEREFLKICGKGISRIQIQRSIKQLFKYGFLRQEVSHRKSILTITHKETYDLIIQACEPRNEPNLSQTRAKLEPESKNDKNVNNEKKIKQQSARTTSSPHQKDLFFSFDSSKYENIKPEDFEAWKIAYPSINLDQELQKSTQWILANPSKSKSKKQWRKFLTGWLDRANDKATNQAAYNSNRPGNIDRRTRNKDGTPMKSCAEDLF